MPGFVLQRLPDLAFGALVQSMEPLDIFSLSQTSHKTRCLMKRNARLPITIDVTARSTSEVIFLKFCGHSGRWIGFSVAPHLCTSETFVMRFGRDKKDWANAYRPDPSGGFRTFWLDTLHGYRTIINYLADTFHVKSVSFGGGLEGSYAVLQHIIDRKLPIQKLEWDSEDSTDAVVQTVLEVATLAKELRFDTPEEKQIQFTRFPEYCLDSICFWDAHWIPIDGLIALNNCLKVKVVGTKFTSVDLNAFLKHLIRNTGRAKEWEIYSCVWFEMGTVLTGIEYDEIAKGRITEKYTIKRLDGVKITVTYDCPIGTVAPRGKRLLYTLKLEVLD